MRLLFTLGVVVALIALEGFLFKQINQLIQAEGIRTAAVRELAQSEGREPTEVESKGDPKVTWLIVASVVNGIATLVIVAFVLVPDVGEFMGNSVYSPDREEKKENPYAPALSAVARGNYDEAVEIYLNMARDNPDDIHAVCEAAKLTATKLGDPDKGIAILENYLELDHDAETAAQLAFFLADLAIREKQDYEYASVVYQQVVASLPGTPQAIRANQELHRLEQKIAATGEDTTIGV